MSSFKESPQKVEKKNPLGSPCCFFCAEEGMIRDQFQWIIRKRHLLWKYVTPPYRILGHCDQIRFTKASQVFDIKSTMDFPPQNPTGRMPLLLRLCVTPQMKRGSRSESSLLDLQCLDKSGLGFCAPPRKSLVLGIARLRQELAKKGRVRQEWRASLSALDLVTGKLTDGIHNWTFRVGFAI